MGTESFNVIDKIIAYLRSSKIKKEIRKNDKVLDFGCGAEGRFLKYVASDVKSGVGIDYDVKNQVIGNLEFKRFKYIDKLPSKLGNFDKVIMLAVLEHIEINKVGQLFSEFRKVLKDGGQIILTTPTKASKPLLEILARLRIISMAEIADHKKYYGFDDIALVASRNRLKLVSYRLFQLGLNSVAILEKI